MPTAEISPLALRQRIRSGQHTANTSGYAAGFVQCNLVILPKDWADEFLQFCQLNPKPCPLVAMASQAGDYMLPDLGEDIDIRSDISGYRIFEHGELKASVADIKDYWRDDLVSFLLGCSFSFEQSLIAEGLEIRNLSQNLNVPMYRTDIDCRPCGRFSGKMVVSMRPFLAADAIRAVEISSRFPSVHGAPIHLGDPALIGINDINQPDFGGAVNINPNELPVFWACGVTPQVILEQAKPSFCITHEPGCMLVTDIPNSQLSNL